MPETADFVMYWWNHAADSVRSGGARRFGLITTNSLTMVFNRSLVEAHCSADPPLNIAFAIADHPWVDSAEGAAARIAMTIGRRESLMGRVLKVTREHEVGFGEVAVDLSERDGIVHADLRTGANLAAAERLTANMGLSFMGMIPLGAGFWIDEPTAVRLGLGTVPGLDQHIRRYVNGKDLVGTPRGVLALDFFGMQEQEVRSRFPETYQWIFDRVRPVRDKDNRESYRRLWWIYAESRPKLRVSLKGLDRYIGTTETAKHRVFTFVDASFLPDQKVRVIASADALHLGVLSTQCHVHWALATGGTLEDRPVYNNTRCFEPFPFPADDTGLTPILADRIRNLAEQLDAHRKARQAAHKSVTLTGLYNVLAKLRSSEPLNAKDKLLHEQGLVSVLRTLHDELDAAVLQAYGWADLGAALADHTPAGAEARAAAVETLLERLVALNAKRAAEEAAGTVRWLRPEFQQRAAGGTQTAIDTGEGDEPEAAPPPPAAALPKRAWPSGLPEQIKCVAEVLAAQPRPMALAELEARFAARGRWRERLPVILDTLVALGRARQLDGAPLRWQAA